MAANFNNALIFGHSGDTATTFDYTMLRTGIVYDAFAVARGAAAGTCTVGKAASAITNAMNVGGSSTAVARAGSIDDANNDLAIGDTLRITKSAAVATWTFLHLAAPGYNA